MLQAAKELIAGNSKIDILIQFSVADALLENTHNDMGIAPVQPMQPGAWIVGPSQLSVNDAIH